MSNTLDGQACQISASSTIAVTGLASFKAGERLVDLTHLAVLGLRRDSVLRSKLEHRRDRDGRARDAPLLQNPREGRDRDRFQRATDEMQPTVRRQRRKTTRTAYWSRARDCASIRKSPHDLQPWPSPADCESILP
jgi:hypothetical protein